jgi:effector-binding domain-containing protein
VFRKQWPAFLLAFVVPIVAVFWWWGGFDKVNITEGEAGPYRYAYLDHEGDIGNARKTQKKVFDSLKQGGIEPGDNVIVLLTDPRTTPKSEQRARVGYTLGLEDKVPQELKEDIIPRRRVLMARVNSGILIAPSKAYQALYDYLKPSGLDIRMPTVEIYRATDDVTKVGELTVEMQR